MSDISETRELRRREDVVVTDLDDELVLLDPETRKMYTLNQTGRRVWRVLDGRSITEIARVISLEYQVDPERAAQDVETVVRDLLEAGLAHEARDD